MNALLEHAWGESPAADRVWSLVTGMAPRRAVGARIVVLQAFMDDSYLPNGTFVLGGHIATTETWANFSREWEELLPRFGTLASNGRYHFKMSEMSSTPERKERIHAFFSVIDKYRLVPIYIQFNLESLQRAKSRIWFLNGIVDWGTWSNPFSVALRLLLIGLREQREIFNEIIGSQDYIELIFDDQAEKKYILETYLEYVEAHSDPAVRLYKTAPRFEDDQQFLPLQAADFFAWTARKWYDEGCPDKKSGLVFGTYKSKQEDRWIITIDMTENQLTLALMDWLRFNSPGVQFYDSGAFPVRL